MLGRKQEPGKRNDLVAAITTLESGGLHSVAQLHAATYVRYHRGLEKLAEIRAPKRDRRVAPTVICLWGESGTGKTRRAFEIAEKSNKPFYVKPSGSKWFDGYAGESIIIIDEVAGQVPLPELMLWLDRYCCALAIAQAHTGLAATKRASNARAAVTSYAPTSGS